MSDSIAITSSPAATIPDLPLFRVARKGGMALGIKLSGACIALAMQIVLTRALGHTGYGEFAYAYGWLLLLLMFAQGGFSIAALRYAAEYRARREGSLLTGFLKRSSQIVLLESVVLALLMAACASAWCDPGSKTSLYNLLIASAALPVFSQLGLHCSIIRGLGHAIQSMLCSLIYPLLFVAAMLTAAAIFPIKLSASRALQLTLGAASCACLIVFLLQRRHERNLDLGRQRSFRTREWFGTASQLMCASSLIYLHSRTGVVITGLLLDARAAGTYALAERVSDAACLGVNAVTVLAAPAFATMYAQGRRMELQRYARLAAWGATAAMLTAVPPLVLFGKPILRLFGPDFVTGYPVLLVLLAGAAANAISGSAGLLLDMTGNHRLNTMAALVSLCINLTLSFLLTPRYGILGAAVANAISFAFWNCSVLLLARWQLAIWPNVGRLASCSVF